MKKPLNVFFAILITGINMVSQTIDNPGEMLPENINGWSALQEDRYYFSEDLFDYIDGGAELYLSYGFKKVYNRIYGQENQPDIFLDIFYMNTSYDAYGVFTHSRETVEQQWGQGSQYTEGAILFWKDNIFVSILTNPETPEAKETIFELAGIIEQSIVSEGTTPPVISLLPEENLIIESIRYFRHHVWLNTFYFVSHENILGITQSTEAVLAKYNYGDSKPILVIIKYPDTESAISSHKIFREIFFPEAPGKSIVKIEDNTYFASFVEEEKIYLVMNSPDFTTAELLLNKAAN